MDHKYKVRIYYEDTDAAGVVFYANYFKFFKNKLTFFHNWIVISTTHNYCYFIWRICFHKTFLTIFKKNTIEHLKN